MLSRPGCLPRNLYPWPRKQKPGPNHRSGHHYKQDRIPPSPIFLLILMGNPTSSTSKIFFQTGTRTPRNSSKVVSRYASVLIPRFTANNYDFFAREMAGKSLRESLARVSLSLIPLLNGEVILVYPIRYCRSVTTPSTSHAVGSSTGNLSTILSGLEGWKNSCFESMASPLQAIGPNTTHKVVRLF